MKPNNRLAALLAVADTIKTSSQQAIAVISIIAAQAHGTQFDDRTVINQRIGGGAVNVFANRQLIIQTYKAGVTEC